MTLKNKNRIDGPTEADVIISGGGPVGIGLAIDLALNGVSSVVIERHTNIQRIPKGQNLTPRTGEHFRRWGVTEAIRAASTIPKEYGGGVVSYGTFLSKFHYEWFDRSKIVEFYAATNERLPQYETEAVLRGRAFECENIKLLTGWSFASFVESENNVTVNIIKTNGTDERTITARYLVGCDGAHSAVREAAGFKLKTDSHDQLMALLVFRSLQLDQKLSKHGEKTIFNSINPEMDGYWQFLGRVDLDCNWFYHSPVPQHAKSEKFDFKQLIEKAVGASIDIEFEYIGFWDLRMSLADTYGEGRVFIAGDAAHSHPPYGGYGINIGFEDARNLSWKLTALLQGWGGENLLASYAAERRPVFESTRDDFILKSIIEDRKFIERYDPKVDLSSFLDAWERRSAGDDSLVTQYLPHYSGSPIICSNSYKSSGAVGVHTVEAREGYHLAPVFFEDGTQLWDYIGEGFTFLSLVPSQALVRAFKDAAVVYGVPLKTIDLTEYSLFDLYEAEALLIRPDQFVAWKGKGERVDANQILARAIGKFVG